MFQKFQDQVRQLMHVNCKEVSRTGSMVAYTVTVLGKDRRVDYRVVFNSSEKDVWCVCRSFQFKGILCSHALAVLRQELVMHIPNKYIMNRWKKNYRLLHESENTEAVASPPSEPAAPSPVQPAEEVGPTDQARETKNYDHLYKHGHHYFADIVELGAMDQDAMDYALSVMKEAREKILKKFEESRGGGGTSISTTSVSEEKGRGRGKGKQKVKEKERDRDKGGGNKGKSGRSASKSTAVPGSSMIHGLNPMLVPPMGPPPPGMIYMPVHPHAMVFPSFTGAMPPIPSPIPALPDTSNVAPETEKPKKTRKRRGS